MMRGVLAAIACGVAYAAAAAEVPPPAKIDDANVTAWIKAYLKTDGWTVIAADGAAVSFGSPKGVSVGADGLFETEIRREYYRPTPMGDLMTRSNLQSWRVNCKTREIQVVAMSIHAENNLAGQSMSRKIAEGPWTTPTPGSQNEHAVKRICDAPTTGKRLN